MPAIHQQQRVTVAVIGQTGAGKSQFLNGYLQRRCFQACANPNAVTLVTSADQQLVNGCLRTGIDTQGLDDTQGVDAAHVQQMVQFLKAWPHGVNAFALVINAQHDRFDAGTQKLVKLINTFFNDPTFWDHVCIVFTKCYAGCDEIDKPIKQQEYRDLVLNLIRECQGKRRRNSPPLPVFFVDSKKFNTDRETMEQYALFNAFVCGLNPLPTQRVVVPNVQYLRIEKQTRNNILAATRYEGNTRIQQYEDQEREKRTGYDGRTITYSDWTAIRTWENRQSRSSRTETRTKCVNETRTPIFRTERYGGRRYGFCGPRSTRQVQCGENVRRTMQEQEREVNTDYDGSVSYGDWQVVREWIS
jgi:predicted GTPase